METRFWSKIDRSGGPDACWLWTAGTNSRGYGKFRQETCSARGAHVVAWELTHGPVPAGLLVCHNCPTGDNPRCVNPAHLWLGTDAENLADRDAKKRQAYGERNGRAILTEDDVRAIRALCATGVSQKRVGQRFGVGSSIIFQIVHRKSWRHVA